MIGFFLPMVMMRMMLIIYLDYSKLVKIVI